jgi:hypothetical protein
MAYKKGKWIQEKDAHILGTGHGSGSVFRYKEKNKPNRKKYKRNARFKASFDHEMLETLRSMNLTAVKVVRSKVVDNSNLDILDDVKGQTVSDIFKKFEHSEVGEEINQEWFDILRLLKKEVDAWAKANKIPVDLSAAEFENDLPTYYFSNQAQDIQIFIHPGNVVVEWSTGSIWIIDPH